ncbi:Pr6Pr family membrane protein [Nocardioides sp. Kera G14]|uniref:Pr6Pr family membrane protein n=1 Tax=Nocardioides sp. Kera G14 TaxID=2884264 RepID=UPI001D124CA1|nr:Pr6Pr family membrane protein [Nocardioides sp. Kera G14]UDY23294.1 Pr6Pr family membrane protein [Nocardioides sp. Kera G14]
MPNHNGVVRGWHAVVAVLVTYAIVGQVVQNIHVGRSLANTFSFFTIQSNILVGVGALLVALDPLRRGPFFEALRLAGLVGITVTGVVFNLLLAGTVDLHGIDVVYNALLHQVIPVLAVLGFLLARPRTWLGPRSWWFLAWAIAWLIYTLVRAEVSNPRFERPHGTSRVPYDFLDRRGDLGWLGVSAYVVVILGVALLLAWGFIAISRRPELSRRRASRA